MIITYSPGEGDVQRWEFDSNKVRATEAELIEKRYGDKWDRFLADLQAGSMKARRVLLWHLLRREHHTLRYEDTPDFCSGEFEVQYTKGELTALRDQILKAPKLTDAERDELVLEIEHLIVDAPEGLDEGKAP